jgi:hypothetical protein
VSEANKKSAEGPMGCEEESWSPEVLTLYGDSATINGKLPNYEMNLPRRRVFGFTVDSDSASRGAFFERTGPDEVTVYSWNGPSDPGLHAQIATAIVRNKGVNCVGEQTKALIAELPSFHAEKGVAQPVNAKAAFSHQIRDAGEGYLRTTVYLMC